MRAALVQEPSAEIRSSHDGEPLLDIDPAAFRTYFNREPFLIGHRLCDHPLFTLPSLIELSKRLAPKDIEYNAGNIPISLDPTRTPTNGLSVEETIRRIEECQSWMVLKYVENDPVYRDLLHRTLAEVRPHSEPIVPGMMQAQGFIFVTSPNSVTPYHMDPEHNFLLQVRGRKRVYQFDARDRSLLSEEELERFYDGAHRNLKFVEANRSKAYVFDFEPGQGLHFPVTNPHWVENGPNVSVSFSITFRTPDLEKRAMAYNVNSALRRRGWKPTPVGVSPWRDTLKVQSFRVLRRLGLAGK